MGKYSKGYTTIFSFIDRVKKEFQSLVGIYNMKRHVT